MRYIVHVLRPLDEHKKCKKCDCSDSQVCNAKISTRKVFSK